MSLVLKNIVKEFDDVTVLKGIDLQVDKGDFLVLLGASGCGKSTLLNCIAGLEDITGGNILINDIDQGGIEPSARDIAMVFQSYALYPSMNTARNITFALECAGVPKADRKIALDKVASILKIDHLLDRKPSQLSGGQRQRVAIGRALVRSPEIFLLDEPMSNLDAKLRNEMRVELRKLHAQLGATFILVTHDQVEAMSMANKIALLENGTVQQYGTPEELYHTPANLFVAQFIGNPKINLIEGEISMKGKTPYFKVDDITIPVKGYKASSKPVNGKQVIMGVRPENVYRDKGRLEGQNFQEINLTVTDTELTGADVNATFDFGGQSMTARFRSTRTPDVGSRQKLFIDVTNCSLFDKTTGERI